MVWDFWVRMAVWGPGPPSPNKTKPSPTSIIKKKQATFGGRQTATPHRLPAYSPSLVGSQEPPVSGQARKVASKCQRLVAAQQQLISPHRRLAGNRRWLANYCQLGRYSCRVLMQGTHLWEKKRRRQSRANVFMGQWDDLSPPLSERRPMLRLHIDPCASRNTSLSRSIRARAPSCAIAARQHHEVRGRRKHVVDTWVGQERGWGQGVRYLVAPVERYSKCC